MKFRLALTSITLSAALLAGCKNPAADKPKAEVAEAVKTTEQAPAATGNYVFTSKDSKVEFVGAKVTGKHDGSFGEFSGTIVLPEGKPEKGSVSVDVVTASVTSDNEKLTGHLKSPDFFDVEKFPKISFRSTSVQPGGANGATHTITGNLDMHGVSKSITFPATIKADPSAVTVNAEFSVNRKDFGINYPGKVDDLIRDDVLVKLKINAKPKAG
jgi:polyisoprenoid-binding protein YceI